MAATERVKEGHLDARAKLTSGDELGVLAGSFNEMMAGVSERDALRDAFGSYVDPDVAERVLDEGELLEGKDVEATRDGGRHARLHARSPSAPAPRRRSPG